MTVIDRVKELPISDVFAAFFPGIEMRRDGRNIVALCPFHQEKTPSFKINVEKNRWHCFASAGCGGGTSIDLLLKAGLASSPIEAGRLIAERFGIKVERGAKGGGGQKGPVKGETPERGLTLSMLSEAKKLPEKFLRDIGLRNFKYMCDPCVLIPYFNELTELFAVRFRLALDGAERFKWRSGDRVSLYGLNRLRSMREKGWGLIGEGESDCWTGWYHNLPVVGIPGKTNWKSEWRRHFENLQVYLWQEPGAEDLTAKISADIPNLLVIPAPDGIKDISEAHIQGIDVARLIEELKRTAIPAERLRREAIDERIRKLREQATKVLQSNDPLELVKEAIRSLGYGGELRPAIITYLAATSRREVYSPGCCKTRPDGPYHDCGPQARTTTRFEAF